VRPWLIQKDDQMRFFVILFFLEDDTIAIREVSKDTMQEIWVWKGKKHHCCSDLVLLCSLPSETADSLAATSWPAPSSRVALSTSSSEREH
jgi:hypothetical protein